MKKNGFTLAEVLITLAIIGVVATLTLPALMTNTAEQQYKSALKKGINTLTEAAQLNQAISGWDYASIIHETTGSDSNESDLSLYNLLKERTQVDFVRSGSGTLNLGASSSSNYTVFFRDGSVLSYSPGSTLATAEAAAADGGLVGSIQNDNLPYGIAALYDVNGTKAPNLLSNCQGNPALTGSTATETDDPDAENPLVSECDQKTKRIIRDQFSVRLRGGYAVPNGPASRWAFEN